MCVGAWQPATAQPSNTPAIEPRTTLTAEQVVDKLVQRNLERAQALGAYRGTRVYRLERHGFPGFRSAEIRRVSDLMSGNNRGMVVASHSSRNRMAGVEAASAILSSMSLTQILMSVFTPIPPKSTRSSAVVEKTPSLMNDVGQLFVVSVGEIALKRRSARSCQWGESRAASDERQVVPDKGPPRSPQLSRWRPRRPRPILPVVLTGTLPARSPWCRAWLCEAVVGYPRVAQPVSQSPSSRPMACGEGVLIRIASQFSGNVVDR